MSVARDLNWDVLKNMTISDLMAHRARQDPFSIALSSFSWRGYRDRLGYAQLDLLGRRVGASLAAKGIRSGQRVAVFLDNEAGREAILTALGCFAIGAVVVPLNTRSSDAQLRHALSLTEPVLTVCKSEARERLQSLGVEVFLQLDAPEASERWPEPAETHLHVATPSPVTSEDLAVLIFTSGTTEFAKALMHTHRSLLAAGFAAGSVLRLGPGELYQGAFPVFTSSCLNVGCMGPWVHGGGFVLEHTLDNRQRLRLINTERTTVYHGVPATIQFMLDEAEGGEYDLRRVRRLAYGGAAMPPATIARISKNWPWMEQINVWGMTESGPSGAWLDAKWLPEKAGSVGVAMPNCELRLVDSDGNEVPADEEGELCFRGPSMAAGYFNDPDATAKGFRDGWLHSGDVFIRDQDGLLKFVDRLKDVINRGGLKISSVWVEAALHRIPGIKEAAAVAVPHPRLGEDIAACIVLAEGSTLDIEDIKVQCRDVLADYEVPRHWYVFDALPRNPIGKVLKRELRELLPHGDGTPGVTP